MGRRLVFGILCCGLALAELTLPTASFAGDPRAPRLLTNFGESSRVRQAMVVFGMVTIAGPHVTAPAYRAGRYGHIVWAG
jgi:hypothetical protein